MAMINLYLPAKSYSDLMTLVDIANQIEHALGTGNNDWDNLAMGGVLLEQAISAKLRQYQLMVTKLERPTDG